MQFGMSETSTFFAFSFLLLDVPNLHRSGACFIPSSISFFPISELNSLVATLTPHLSSVFAPNFVTLLAMFPALFPIKLPPV